MNQPNIALLTLRQSRTHQFGHFFVVDSIYSKDAISMKDRVTGFPLYVYDGSKHETSNATQKLFLLSKTSNFKASFLDFLEKKIGESVSPERIFSYIYAIFHSNQYRILYSEFLKVDFPRIPFTSSNSLFKRLSGYGSNLIDLHLMESEKLKGDFRFFEHTGDCAVDPGHPKYKNGKVIINKQGDGFTEVPEEVWNFHVGGYQVCHKWLKDRKGRTLSDDDILHYQKIIVALQETICIMQQIDDAIPSWPIE
jgi:predicted helicase